jgi:hypothetical protein
MLRESEIYAVSHSGTVFESPYSKFEAPDDDNVYDGTLADWDHNSVFVLLTWTATL